MMKIESMVLLQLLVIEVRIKTTSGSDDERFEYGIFENFQKTKEILFLEDDLIRKFKDEEGKQS